MSRALSRVVGFVGRGAVAIALAGLSAGCGGGSSQPAPSTGAATSATSSEASKPEAAAPNDGAPAAPPRRKFEPVKLGSSDNANGKAGGKVDEQAMGSVLDAMQPLQVVLGKWRGVTQKPLEGSVKVEEPEWIWDFRTNKEQPALVVNASASPYFKNGRITFLTASQEFQFSATDRDGVERVYRGTFTEPPQDVPGEDKKLHRTYKLTLKQVTPEDERKLAQVVFAQQENNRYLMQVFDKRGESVMLVNTVANQRSGTSFALNPDDYGEKKCVVSGGLGTSTVSHNGKTYYVCCSGCQAAFNDDPERWIAKFEASNKKKPE